MAPRCQGRRLARFEVFGHDFGHELGAVVGAKAGRQSSGPYCHVPGRCGREIDEPFKTQQVSFVGYKVYPRG